MKPIIPLKLLATAFAFFVFNICAVAGEGDWMDWRGPNGNGVAEGRHFRLNGPNRRMCTGRLPYRDVVIQLQLWLAIEYS